MLLLQADTGRSGGDLSAGTEQTHTGSLSVEAKFISMKWDLSFCCGNLCTFVNSGSSPHPSTPDEDDSQTELLIAEEKLSPEDEGQMMPRYETFLHSTCDGWQQTSFLFLI